MIALHAAFAVLLAAYVGAVPTVQLGATTITGRDVPNLKQEFFGGIPYAEPPLGPLRLRPPILKTNLKVKTFSAVNFGSPCLQALPIGSFATEDCLTLNIFRPAGIPPKTSLPVLTWLHGGGFLAGSAAEYNGSAIVAHSMLRGTPIIYVNMNYRLGPLGFPQGQEAKKKGSLNLGLKDQLAGLQWIQKNIGKFGGDKNKVTLAGQSAGSIAVAILLLNPHFGKLARAAILESGSAATVSLNPPERHESAWQDFVGAVDGCKTGDNTFQCIHAANTSAILKGIGIALSKAKESFPYSPVLDGKSGVLPDLPSRLLQKGHFARLPFMAGAMLDEGTGFVNPRITSVLQTQDLLGADVLETTIEQLLALYPNDPALGSPFNTGNNTFGLNPEYKRASAIVGDLAFESQRRFLSHAASARGVKHFAYLFTDPQSHLPPFLGVPHAAELPYLYGGLLNAFPSAQSLSLMMFDYWISFTTGLDPNDGRGNKRPNWPQYTSSKQVLLQLNGANTTVIPDTYRSAQLDFFNKEPAIWHHRRWL